MKRVGYKSFPLLEKEFSMIDTTLDILNEFSSCDHPSTSL